MRSLLLNPFINYIMKDSQKDISSAKIGIKFHLYHRDTLRPLQDQGT